MKNLIKEAFKNEEFVKLFREFCEKSQEFADCMIWHHYDLYNNLIDKYKDHWVEGVVIEVIEDDELIDISNVSKYIRF